MMYDTCMYVHPYLQYNNYINLHDARCEWKFYCVHNELYMSCTYRVVRCPLLSVTAKTVVLLVHYWRDPLHLPPCQVHSLLVTVSTQLLQPLRMAQLAPPPKLLSRFFLQVP